MMSKSTEVPTPRRAAQSGLRHRPDSELPLIAAEWLVSGLDGPELVELACLGRSERIEARRLLPAVLSSLGFPMREQDDPRSDKPWRGHWGQVEWAVREIDSKLTPFAGAQHVLQVLGDEPDLWEAGGGDSLYQLVAEWNSQTDRRSEIDTALRGRLTSLREDQVPPREIGRAHV